MSRVMRNAVAFTALGAEMFARASTNGQVAYQEATGETFVDGVNAVAAQPDGMIRLRRLMWSLLLDQDDMTIERAGDVIDDIGLMAAIEIIGKATEKAFPDDDADKAAAGNGKAAKAGKAEATPAPKPDPT